MKKTIEIDVDVNRAIENGRLTFGETPNAILRRLLAIDPRTRPPTRERPPRTPRSSGAYSTFLGDEAIEANSLKELLRMAILRSERRRAGLIEALGDQATPRGRRIVARSPEALYPHAPQLIEFAEKLDGTWWFDSNVGRKQATAYLGMIAKLVPLPNRPAINKRSEKTTMTLADLDP